MATHVACDGMHVCGVGSGARRRRRESILNVAQSRRLESWTFVTFVPLVFLDSDVELSSLLRVVFSEVDEDNLTYVACCHRSVAVEPLSVATDVVTEMRWRYHLYVPNTLCSRWKIAVRWVAAKTGSGCSGVADRRV